MTGLILSIFLIFYFGMLVGFFFAGLFIVLDLVIIVWRKIYHPSYFIVTAHRYGKNDSHNYVVGVFSSKFIAEIKAAEEELDRAGKYDCKITEVQMDEKKDYFTKKVRMK